jgi:hypothetical protein
MCKKCAEAIQEIFPEVPQEERSDFLMCCTCYPFDDHEKVRTDLLDIRQKMKTDDYHECYAIADEEIDVAMKKVKIGGEDRLQFLRSLCNNEEELTLQLLAAENRMTENKEHLVVLRQRDVISEEEFMAKLNRCLELFIGEATTILGAERCRSIYDYAAGDQITGWFQ